LLDNDGILVTLVLNEQEMLGAAVRQRTAFARIPLDILAGTEPSLREQDMNGLVDQIVVEIRGSDDFELQRFSRRTMTGLWQNTHPLHSMRRVAENGSEQLSQNTRFIHRYRTKQS
jgi:hypothetical protein